MKRGLIWLLGGSVSHRWTIPLIGQSSEHNFRRVERDISCLGKLFQGILYLYIKSKRLGSQEILSQSAQWQWAVLQQCATVVMFTAYTHMSLQGMISVVIKQLTLNGTVVCEMFSSPLLSPFWCTNIFLKNWVISMLLCFFFLFFFKKKFC